MMTECITLRCGTLRLRIEQADMGLHELCGFASRRSRKRGFVFVSRVLGKHIPVRPRVMADVHARLAAKVLDAPGPVVLIAMAETATGLGQGVFEELLLRSGRDDVLFLHSTRYRLRRRLALDFEEVHSHAPEHLLYEPDDSLFHQARSLILVDDEISTGRTLANLARAYRGLNSRLGAVHLVCLTDWLGAARRAALSADISAPVSVHSLLSGSFEFAPDPGFEPLPSPPAVGRGAFMDELLTANHGRLGLRRPRDYDLNALIAGCAVRTGERLLVLGTGEFAHPPYLLARRLEEQGWDVHFQTTTRSPLAVERDISSALEFVDNYGDGIANYVYNVADRRYERIIIGYETRPLPTGHCLPATLGAAVVHFDSP